jgi:16S rRNA (cytosine1402-N4)-methyltransferase
MEKSIHRTVLLNETIESLNLSENAIVVDGTFGGGGHSALVFEKFKNPRVIAIDQDASALSRGKERFAKHGNISFHLNNFRDLDKVLEVEKVSFVDGIILDLGLSSDQLTPEVLGRGFSFMKDEPLYMTMKENPNEDDVTAKEIVNTWSEESLADIIYGYGEEKLARRIAKGIVLAREEKEISTTFELVEVIRNSIKAKYTKGKIHFATRTFQALRIAVNDELTSLEKGLEGGFEILKKDKRMSVIAFHSLEDRIVKNFYKKKKDDGDAILITKKPIIAGEEELKKNNRSRSAKLRIIEKIK